MAYILCLILSCLVLSTPREFLTLECYVQHRTELTSSVYLNSALMDLCLMLELGYLADAFGWASVDFFPRFPCKTFGPGGLIVQTAATTRYSGHQLAHERAYQHFFCTLFNLERELLHPPAAIHADVLLLCISQQSFKKMDDILQEYDTDTIGDDLLNSLFSHLRTAFGLAFFTELALINCFSFC